MPVNQRLEGVLSLVVPGGVSYWKGEQDDGSHTRQFQRSLLDTARDSSKSGWTRLGAGVGAILEQPGAVLNDIARAITKVPGQLWAAGGDVGEALKAESLTGAAYELTEAVEKTAGAAETVVGTAVLVRGAARARVVEESRTAGRTRTTPAEGKPQARTADQPTDLYDGAAWDAYYRAHPELQRSVGAAGARRAGSGRSYEVLAEAPIRGKTRSGHRRSALKDLERQLEQDPALRQQMDDALGGDVLTHMRSGKGALKNPPETELHHPKDTPASVEVLRRKTHRDPSLQDILHEDDIGGFGTHYGKKRR